MSERGRCGLEEAVKLILRVMSQRLCIVSLLIMKYLIVYPYFPQPPKPESAQGPGGRAPGHRVSKMVAGGNPFCVVLFMEFE